MDIKMNLKTKMLALILAPVIILTGFLSLYGYNTSKDALNNQIIETSRFTMESYSENLNSILLHGKISAITLFDCAPRCVGSNTR